MRRVALYFVLATAAIASPECQDRLTKAASMTPERRVAALREIIDDCHSEMDFKDQFFVREAQLRPALRALSAEPERALVTRWLLALVGDHEDIRYLLNTPDPQRFAEDRWKYSVVVSLLDPHTESEWDFLREAAYSDADRWVDFGALLALKLISSPKSAQILEQVAEQNPKRGPLATQALEYKKGNPPALESPNIQILAARLGTLVTKAKFEGVHPPIYNLQRDKALIDIDYRGFMDSYLYTATVHRHGALWRLCGLRETLQAFAPPPYRVTRALVPIPKDVAPELSPSATPQLPAIFSIQPPIVRP